LDLFHQYTHIYNTTLPRARSL